jgi:LysR family transcriptional regulator, carnitine catabolism transcriptional activator
MLVRDSATHEQVAGALAANRVAPERDYEVANMFTALSMVRAGFGVTFIPALVLREVNMAGLTWKRLQRPVPLRRIGICRRKDRSASPAASEFERLLRAEVQRTREHNRRVWDM